MNEQEKQELINKIRQLSFSCVDDGEEAAVERKSFAASVEQGIIPFLDRAQQLVPILDSESGYAALGEWLKDLKNFDKAHLALHYAIMGGIIDSIRNTKVYEITLEAFDENIQCMKEVGLVSDIRSRLQAVYDKGEPKRKMEALKKRIKNGTVKSIAAVVLQSNSSYSNTVVKYFPESAILNLLKIKLCEYDKETSKLLSEIDSPEIETLLSDMFYLSSKGFL